jgi:tRNA pseudouridine55 synthase
MQGLILVDKPAGWTSFDVVNYVRRIVAQAEGKKPKNVKVGHTGTLDPFATGLLVLLIGKAYTRRAGELSKLDKTYEITMKLGSTSTTGDPEGEITPYIDPESAMDGHPEQAKRVSGTRIGISKDPGTIPTKDQLESALVSFRGEISQVPPIYSAIKINGQRAYKLARLGKEVIIEPRKVTIKKLELVGYTYPEVKLVADVSSGTYIRTLVEDIGQAINTGAYTTALRRTQVGRYSLDEPHISQLKTLDISSIEDIITQYEFRREHQ